MDLIDKLFSTDNCTLDDSVMSDYLQNIWPETLVVLYDCFSISNNSVSDPRHIFYIKELVEKRNAVAHGRISPIEAGANMRSKELELRYKEISLAITYLFDCFENYITNREFIAAVYR